MGFGNEESVTIEDVMVIKETDKALLCLIEDDEHWIPKSQIEDESEVFEMGTEGTLVVSQWIAAQKNLV